MSGTTDPVTFEELEALDVISVELVPERRGLILKHCEYYVSSRRHGTTVTRRYNDFVQLYDVLSAKYPYRAICRLPPKRVVVGGGSPLFLQRRRAALQRWLTLVARHPIMAHDADVRIFLCEATVRLDKPKHDEFVLAGTQEDGRMDMSIEEMQAAAEQEEEELRLMHLGLGRLFEVFERVESRCEAERSDIRELGAGLSALATKSVHDNLRWTAIKQALKIAANLTTTLKDPPLDEELSEDSSRLQLARAALSAHDALRTRMTRGLHAERAAAAAAPAAAGAGQRALRGRQRYAQAARAQEAAIARAYALSALESLGAWLGARGAAHAQAARLWAGLRHALQPPAPAPAHRNIV